MSLSARGSGSCGRTSKPCWPGAIEQQACKRATFSDALESGAPRARVPSVVATGGLEVLTQRVLRKDRQGAKNGVGRLGRATTLNRTKAKPKPKTIDEYIAAAPAIAQKRLREMRKCLRAAAPDAEEALKWGSPALSYETILFI